MYFSLPQLFVFLFDLLNIAVFVIRERFVKKKKKKGENITHVNKKKKKKEKNTDGTLYAAVSGPPSVRLQHGQLQQQPSDMMQHSAKKKITAWNWNWL